MATPASGTILRVGGTTDRDPRPTLESRGHVVLECRGPNGASCPIVDGAGCRLVDLSLGIVFQLDLDDPYNREILQCYRTKIDRTIPIQVTATPDQAVRFADDLVGTSVITNPADPHLNDLSARVTTADLARQALAELVSSPSATRSTRTPDGHFTVDWAV
jgi:hypothetical protein